MCIRDRVKGGFAERKGKQLIPTKNGNSLICILPDMLTSPQLTAEWENNLTQIAKGAADPGEFLSGIEAMARELVPVSYTHLTDDMGGTAAGIIALLCEKLPFMAGADFTPEVAKVLDSKKVSDHHAIIPTMEPVSYTHLMTQPP